MKKIILFNILFLFICSQIPAEEIRYGITPLADEVGEPEPYIKDEFPSWAWKVRRFEVIFFGGVPLMYLFTTLGYDLYQYAAHGHLLSFTIEIRMISLICLLLPFRSQEL